MSTKSREVIWGPDQGRDYGDSAFNWMEGLFLGVRPHHLVSPLNPIKWADTVIIESPAQGAITHRPGRDTARALLRWF
jgi:hypothetical protein